MYDKSSTSSTPAMSNLAQAIFETDFKISVKRPPVLLIGGLEAWKQEVGEAGVIRGNATAHELPPIASTKPSEPLMTPLEPTRNSVSPANSITNIMSPIPSPNSTSPLPNPHPVASSSTSHHQDYERWLPTRPPSGAPDSADRRYYSTQTPIVKYSYVARLSTL